MRRVVRTLLSLLVLLALGLALLAAPAEADPTSGKVLVLVGRPRRAALEEAVRIELADRAVEVVSDEAPTGDTSVERADQVARLVAQWGAAAALWIEPPVVPGSLPSVSALDAATGQVRYAAMPRPSAQVGARVFAVVAASLLDELARAAAPVPESVSPLVVPVPEEDRVTAEPPAEAAAPPEPLPPPAPPPAVRVEPAAAAPGVHARIEGAPGVGLDFVPFLGTSLATRGRGTRWLSFNALGGMSSRLRGVELSGLLGIVREDVRGVQLAGVAALGGADLVGIQFGGVADFLGGSVRGAQLAGVASWSGGPVDGLQFAGVATVAAGPLEGLQFAGVGAVANGPVEGVQFAGVASYAGGPFEGVQASGVAGVAHDDVRGVQLAGVVNVATGNVRGLQLGLLNIAGGDVEGVQLGLVNVSRRTSVPIGLVSVMRKGDLAVEVTGSDGGLLTGALLHGSGPLHVQYRAGGQPFDALVQLGFGLGANIPLRDSLFLAIDLTGDHVAPTDDLGAFGILSTARFGAGLRLGPRLAVLGGLTYSAFITERTGGTQMAGGAFASKSDDFGRFHMKSWPGMQLGLRIE